MTEMDWNAVVGDLGPRLHRYFLAGFQEFEAADLVQETLIRLVRRFEAGDFDPARGSLRMYAFGIAHFVRLEALKARPAQLAEEIAVEEAAAEGHENALLERERALRLRRLIAAFPSPQQEIFLLLIDDELSLGEIGQILGIPLNTVKSHIHRGKALLKEKLERNEA